MITKNDINTLIRLHKQYLHADMMAANNGSVDDWETADEKQALFEMHLSEILDKLP